MLATAWQLLEALGHARLAPLNALTFATKWRATCLCCCCLASGNKICVTGANNAPSAASLPHAARCLLHAMRCTRMQFVRHSKITGVQPANACHKEYTHGRLMPPRPAVACHLLLWQTTCILLQQVCHLHLQGGKSFQDAFNLLQLNLLWHVA